jgi:hypothetical protein
MILGVLGNAGAGKDTIGKMIVEATGGETLALADPMKQFVQRVFGFTHQQLWGPSDCRNAPDYRFGAKWWQPWKKRSVANLRAHVLGELEVLETFRWLRDLMPEADEAEVYRAWRALVVWAMNLLAEGREYGFLTPRKVLQTLGTEWGRDFNEDMWIDFGIRFANKRIETERVPVVVITDCRFLNEARKINAAGHVWRVTRPGYDGNIKAGVAGHRSERDQVSDEIKQYVNLEITNNGSLADLARRVRDELERIHGTHRDVQRCG